MSPVLELKNLQTHFETRSGTVRAVDGVSYHVNQGETLGVVGESGCGKSVTALSILRLIPNPPGRIVGELGISDRGPRYASVRAIAHCELATLSSQHLAALLEDISKRFDVSGGSTLTA